MAVQFESANEAGHLRSRVGSSFVPSFVRRAPLLAVSMLTMACGAWLGLVRLGWNLPLPWPDQLVSHGPLMIGGFLGTMIGLERAVALGSPWGYAAPVVTAAGALLLDFGSLHPAGPALIAAGSLMVTAMFVVSAWREPSLPAVTLAVGAASWATGNAQWLAGRAVFRVVFWWVAFLVLTIAGERLELSRVLRRTRAVHVTFAAAAGAVLAGAAVTVVWPEPGVRLLGIGLTALAWWLVRWDIARRTVRQRGLPRFMSLSLLGGYVWLGAGGVLAVAAGAAAPGVFYDATLHAIFVGFVISMLFAHAPVIMPEILGLSLEYRPAWYLHVATLHLSLMLRVVGDLVEDLARLRVWGGLLNAIALLIFLINTGWAARMKRAG